MKLYLISQNENDDYDTYDAVVVCAPDELTARNTKPSGGQMTEKDWKSRHSGWCKSPDAVSVTYIGEASADLETGVILASFCAG